MKFLTVIPLALVVVLGCSSSPAKAGDEGEPCLPNMTCNGALSCVANLCVNLAADGSTQDTANDIYDARLNERYTGMCPAPADVSGFVPPPYVPASPPQMKCTSTALQGYYDNCLGQTATQTKCTAFRGANMDCTKCIESAKTDASWGPIIFGSGLVTCNFAGCLELMGDKTCAIAYEKLTRCQDLGCDQCPVIDVQSYGEYQKCVAEVTAGGCKPYNDDFWMQCTKDASAPARACSYQSVSLQECYDHYSVLWCGGGG